MGVCSVGIGRGLRTQNSKGLGEKGGGKKERSWGFQKPKKKKKKNLLHKILFFIFFLFSLLSYSRDGREGKKEKKRKKETEGYICIYKFPPK